MGKLLKAKTARQATYVIGTLGLLLNGSAVAIGAQHFGVPWYLTVGVLVGEVVLLAPLVVVLSRRSRASTDQTPT